MVRLLIEDVTIRKGEQVQLDVRFRGGKAKTLMLPRPVSFCESHKQNPAMVAEMDRLLDDFNYADVARILNEKGYKTCDGLPLTSPAVGYIRTAYGLKSCFDRHFVQEGCLPWLRLQRGVVFQQTQFPIGDKRFEFVRMPLTIETNFFLKTPGLIHPGSTFEGLGWQSSQVLNIRRRREWHDGISGDDQGLLRRFGQIFPAFCRQTCRPALWRTGFLYI
jgi:hypothetical protein